jgi:glycosyltransferase involved in cell wall biosynthesis
VLHIHTEAITPIFALLGKLAGIRVIALTPHNVFRFHGLLRVRKYLERWFIRRLGGRYGMISEGVRRCEWDLYRNPGVRTWNWLDTAKFHPPTPEERIAARQAIGCKEDRFVILSVANCNAVKNHPAILRAIAFLPASLRCEYLHVGREQPDRPEEALAKELGIADQVRFLGSQNDTIPFFWAADAFVMPSIIEGLPISAIEAIAAGVPAVLAATEGLCDVIAETHWSFTTDTSAESVAKGLSQLAQIPSAERMRRAGIDSDLIRKRFSMPGGVRSIVENLYGAPVQSVTNQ